MLLQPIFKILHGQTTITRTDDYYTTDNYYTDRRLLHDR